jgi:hypothetical protein
MIFRGASGKSETTFVKHNQKLVHKCGFRFSGRASEQAELFDPKVMKSRFWGPNSEKRFFCSACSEARPENLKPHL